jgi:hypothetical protein
MIMSSDYQLHIVDLVLFIFRFTAMTLVIDHAPSHLLLYLPADSIE